ncbi:MAG TPA: YkoF family thiamine/hydroxymethylpyrimidine-binding protein [Lentimicrobium sp.]|jgi:uncharacterized protein YqgV (UPF0045/DUF77 family)|nr:YkoF family thiamine/hydroxymethylpyrimidine-binding protein [Lentimicrobium sp.]
MLISVEISYYPLNEEYKKPILSFIDSLKQNQKLIVRTNTMATQVFGEFDEVMSSVSACIKGAFELPHSVFVIKVINADLRD